MTRVADQDRKRKYAVKNKTGCKTCKARRVKCDETRPHCRQCTSRGRECAGYGTPPASGQEIRIEVSTSSSVFASRREHRAFAYFQQRTSNHLAGLVDVEFWSSILLRLARSDCSIRHAVVALAAVHEDYEQRGQCDVRTNQFALQQYNHAIRSHIDRPGKSQALTPQCIESYLASCTAFICIEMLQGHPASAIALIKQAVKLFYSLPATAQGASSSSIWPAELFEALICHLQFMAVGLIGRELYAEAVPPRIQAWKLPVLPAAFSSVAQAKMYLDFYFAAYELSRQSSSKGYILDPNERNQTARDAMAAYRDLLIRWSAAFDTLKTQCSSSLATNERDRRALVILDIRRKFLTTLADFSRWDLCVETFHEILDAVEPILEGLRSTAPFDGSEGSRIFTLELGVVSPLYMIARACRDPMTRRRAIRLLRRSRLREGLWDSLTAAGIAERIMELEEAAAGKEVKVATDIPPWARLSETAVSFDAVNSTLLIHPPQINAVSRSEERMSLDEIVILS